ncbi:Glucoamylase [Nitrospira tepida]|uniref:Glucoamylase n=1 Tax=Nitrospira tepida TaxID=2973512 RepID=A0AA86MYP9_9BACT|nr:glycoside hydrolase family 15 protein [Nitrospira tepida]CAI4031496.1 Glucoamylase [Nitrospira tepida]
MTNSGFTSLHRLDGYLPIEDHGLIGDGATAALIGRDGSIAWLCLPRFDSPPLFCRLLDRERGGAFRIEPDGLRAARQYYEPDSAVLVTEMQVAEGTLRLADCCPLVSGADLTEDLPATRNELLRRVTVLEGTARLRIEIEPRGGAEAEPRDGGLRIRCLAQPDLHLHLGSTIPLTGLRTSVTLKAGQSLDLLLCWRSSHVPAPSFHPEQLYGNTVAVWRRWLTHLDYHGPQESLVRRSAITLKLLDHFANGAIVAAPTSSLPELIGGSRNWDYRYAWVRDAAFSVYALHRIGLSHEAAGFLAWVLDAVERDGRPHVMYDLDGRLPPEEREDPDLEGYRRSRPVRWGNAAAAQHQHDVYGEILDCAYQWAAHHGEIPERLWARLRKLAESAAQEWRQPDHGIWEVRTSGRPFTYSAAMCQVALDRAARMAARFKLPGPCESWTSTAEDIARAIREEAWDDKLQSLTEHLGGGGLDASLLALPLRRVIKADHPKMVATTRAVVERLGVGQGLLYRYLPDESPDGIAGHEGAFLLCSFWLVDNLAKQGRLDEALELYDSLCERAGALGLLPEEIDPSTGAFLGNYPQAFSHIGVIASGVNLARLLKQAGRTK